DGRVKAAQPATGFRSGLDAVMLAAAVPGRAGERALELGAGAGTASLCLAARVPGLTVTGVEIDPALAALAKDNAAANGLDGRREFRGGGCVRSPARPAHRFRPGAVQSAFSWRRRGAAGCRARRRAEG